MKVYNSGKVVYCRNYRIRKGRFISFIAILVLLSGLLFFLNKGSGLFLSSKKYQASDLNPDILTMYFTIGLENNIPWYYLAAVDKAEDIPEDHIDEDRISAVAAKLIGINDTDPIEDYLKNYKNKKSFFKSITREVEKLSNIIDIYSNKTFPLDISYEYTFEDGYGDARIYGGERQHEGTDIMCDKEVPVLSVCDGVVEQVGWLELGGWRVGIRGNDGIYYYYAHLSRYEGIPNKGDKVSKGQVIGYAGDTGYGDIGTTGQFPPHLHFGMYEGKGGKMRAFNPYPILVAWEKQTLKGLRD